MFFSQLDHVLCPQENQDMVYDCWTCRDFALNSHHFATIIAVDVKFQKHQKVLRPRKSISCLKDPSTCQRFYEVFSQSMSGFTAHNDLDAHEQHISEAYKGASNTLLCCVAKPKNLGYLMIRLR